MNIFERHESEVRGYCRNYPEIFDRASGAHLYDREGRPYLDFLAGAGVLNYGHNHPEIKQALLDYLARDGVTHSLDLHTAAKERFLSRFVEIILEPRGLSYKVQFPGPTGTNAVEAALKLARKVTGRAKVMSFTNGFHGMTLGSLAVTGNQANRDGAGVPLHNVERMPFAGYFGEDVDTIDHIAILLEDDSSGVDKPAAAIVETVQAEGGVNPASSDWLRRLAALLRRHDILLIVDDIQAGCGRTGPFFSFEHAGLRPDIVCLSKSLSGFGLPLSVVLIRPELDQWSPGEHNGTFRGHNPAFVTGAAALEIFWQDDTLSRQVDEKAKRVQSRFQELAQEWGSPDTEVRGRGLMQGLVLGESLASEVSAAAFEHGLIIETAGANGEVLKLLPPLNLSDEELEQGLDIIAESLADVVQQPTLAMAGGGGS